MLLIDSLILLGRRFQKISSFSVITLGLLLQTFASVVEASIVGRSGHENLAFLGISGGVLNTLYAFPLGLAIGVQTATAKQTKIENYRFIFGRSLLMASILGAILTTVVALASKFLPHRLAFSVEMELQAQDYLQFKGVSLFFYCLNSAFAGLALGQGKVLLWLKSLIASIVIGLLVEVVLLSGSIANFSLGIVGVGISSVLSSASALFIYFLNTDKSDFHAFSHFSNIRKRSILTKGLDFTFLASATQYFIFNLGMLLFLASIKNLGTQLSALVTILIDIQTLLLVPACALGMLALNGQGDRPINAKSGHDHYPVSKILYQSLVISGVLGISIVLLSPWILKLFLTDPEKVRAGIAPLRLLGLFLPVDAIGIVCMNSIYAQGKWWYPFMISSGSLWGLLVPLTALHSNAYFSGESTLWYIIFAWKCVQSVLYFGCWRFTWAPQSLEASSGGVNPKQVQEALC